MTQVEIISRDENALYISLNGEIDSGNAEEFFKTVSTAYAEKACNLVFSCEGLDCIDSTTLGTFVKLTKMAKADGYTTTLRGLQAKVKKLFLICALNTIMEID